jgi:hypothetical protein
MKEVLTIIAGIVLTAQASAFPFSSHAYGKMSFHSSVLRLLFLSIPYP